MVEHRNSMITFRVTMLFNDDPRKLSHRQVACSMNGKTQSKDVTFNVHPSIAER